MDQSYRILGLKREGCTTADVTKAYRKLALQNHPDKVGADGEAKMKAINAARDDILDSKDSQTPVLPRTSDYHDSYSDSDHTDEDENVDPTTPGKPQNHKASEPEVVDDIDEGDDYVYVERAETEAEPNAKVRPEASLEDSFTDQAIDWSTTSEFFDKTSERLNKMSSGPLTDLHQRLNRLHRFDVSQGHQIPLYWQRMTIQLGDLKRVLYSERHSHQPSKNFCILLAEMLMTIRRLYVVAEKDLSHAQKIDKACDLPFMLKFVGIQSTTNSVINDFARTMSGLFNRKEKVDAEDPENPDLSFIEPWLRDFYPMVEKRWELLVKEWYVETFWEFVILKKGEN